MVDGLLGSVEELVAEQTPQITAPTIPELPSSLPSDGVETILATEKLDNFRPRTGMSEAVAERAPATLLGPPQFNETDESRYVQEDGSLDDSVHYVQGSRNRGSTTIRSGSMVFTWNDSNQKKVPYWVVPDGLADDPFLVEKILSAMKLPCPNLILRFSRLKQPVHEWRSGWNFDFTNDGYVEESALPRALPPGMSRSTTAVQKYLASVAKDRVLDILRSVSSACNQAGAWLQISDSEPGEEPLGFYDHVAPLVGQAAQKETVVYTTYCLEDRRKYPGGAAFCHALTDNAGVEGHEFPQMRPKPFTEDVTAEMASMGLIDKQEEEGNAVFGQSGTPHRGSLFDVEVENFFKDRVYLPSKDLSHMLVFESKSTQLAFKQQLTNRTPVGNFIMQGSVAAMNMFASSMKDGTPVFVLNGTGGAADRIALLIQHMRWRKRIAELGGGKTTDDDGDDDQEDDDTGGAGCFPWAERTRAKVQQSDLPKPPATRESAPELEEAELEGLTVRQLVAAVEGKAEQLQREVARAEGEGDLVRGMTLKAYLHALRQSEAEAKETEGRMLQYMQKDAADEEEQSALDREFAAVRERVRELVLTHGKAARPAKGSPQARQERVKERTRNLTVVMPSSRDPPEYYNQQVHRGREGLAWERRVGRTYEQWSRLPEEDKGDEQLPPSWPLLWVGSDECKQGSEDGVPMPCRQPACSKCGVAQVRRRRFLRQVATWDKDWLELDARVRQEYVVQWVKNNPLSDDPSMVALAGHDKVAELSRVIFSNVYEPPVPDAVVVVQTLDVDLSVEEVMDKVTLAMSTDGLVSEVGERRAFRERMLEAWKMVRVFRYNAAVQNRRIHVFNLLIIALTFASVLAGTLTYQVSTELDQAEAADEEGSFLGFVGAELESFHDALVAVNVALPLAASFVLALNSKFSPQNKYNSLVNALFAVESEIYKYRAKVGEYSTQGGLLQAAPEPDAGSGADSGGKSKREPPKRKNPRQVFSSRLDYVWSELGSSELKQESLQRPKHIDHTMSLDRTVAVPQHPALFEEGKVLQSGDRKLVRETIERYTREVEDDGLRTISAQDYLDIRLSEFHRRFQKRAPLLSRMLNFLQLLIFLATTTSTALGAFNLSQWIPVAMAFGAAIGSIVAYTQLEARLQRVNSALVAMSKLHIWWQRLSVIEQRIPHNKTFMVETAESILQAEAGCNLVNAQIEEEEDAEEGGQESKGG